MSKKTPTIEEMRALVEEHDRAEQAAIQAAYDAKYSGFTSLVLSDSYKDMLDLAAGAAKSVEDVEGETHLHMAAHALKMSLENMHRIVHMVVPHLVAAPPVPVVEAPETDADAS